MLAYCTTDGLTCNRKVFKRGDIFVLPTTMEAEFGGLTDSQMSSRQKQIYGKELFRLPTPDELVNAYRLNKIVLDWCTDKEKRIISLNVDDKGDRMKVAAKAIADTIETPEEEEEDVEPVAIESKGAETDVAPDKPKTRRTSGRKKK